MHYLMEALILKASYDLKTLPDIKFLYAFQQLLGKNE